MPHKTYFNWSTGKDSALALYKMLQQESYSVQALVTIVNSDLKRVSMHGLRNEFIHKQAESIGMPLKTVCLSGNVSMSVYDRIIREAIDTLKSRGYTHTVFGDIFLDDLRAYREAKLQEAGIKPEFPLWKQNTRELFLEFINLGFKAITVCVNAHLLDKSFVGRVLDEQFLNDLPEGVDPCGENGEFHTFVFDGPIFKTPIDFKIGEKVLKTYTPVDESQDECFIKDDKAQQWDTDFWYCDLLLP